jgi:hypothetical protein
MAARSAVIFFSLSVFSSEYNFATFKAGSLVVLNARSVDQARCGRPASQAFVEMDLCKASGMQISTEIAQYLQNAVNHGPLLVLPLPVRATMMLGCLGVFIQEETRGLV